MSTPRSALRCDLRVNQRRGCSHDCPGEPLQAGRKNTLPSTLSTSRSNHLNSGLENRETSPKCFHLSHGFLLNFIRADNLYIHLQGNVI